MNVELAHRALERIREDPTHWLQRRWRCGSGMCFAGFVAQEAGGEWLIETAVDDTHWSSYLIAENGDPVGRVVRHQERLVIHVSVRAQRLLDVDDLTADLLFSSYNNLDRLERLIAEAADA